MTWRRWLRWFLPADPLDLAFGDKWHEAPDVDDDEDEESEDT